MTAKRSAQQDVFTMGIDIGSTTAKIVLRRGDTILFEKYERHFSQIKEKAAELISLAKKYTEHENIQVAISGSAGLGLANSVGIPFVQEVFATSEVVRTTEPDTSCVIELGGEDAKIIFFDNGIDERMNGTCAGGTGAFIDQMATLLNVTADELDELSLKAQRLYTIASRCGVFAKTDIQPLLNQGARKEDVAASIYQAVVNQTVAGLSQGKRIRGKVLFLGGPLYYCKGLRLRFKETLGLDDSNAIFPDYARFAVAYGASLYAQKENKCFTADELIYKIANSCAVSAVERLSPIFNNEEEYQEFAARHKKATVKERDISSYSGNAYLGIDCGSTTTKLVLLSESNELLYSYYASNQGNPVEIVRAKLCDIYSLCGDRVKICGSAVTGYGEELIRHAFSVDFGIVETIAHYRAAKYFEPDVDFILDIGGQDIKCFKIKNGAIDSIMLNEACSSGCGSFLETFAKALGFSIADFAKKGLFATAPVNLGSRCTVFMNSSVKQSQKDGASVEDISAGLSISVVKNAIYKVIRATSVEELGQKTVVQGGTFHNDAVLRAFEQEIGRNVIRPAISGLMGAYGAALYSRRAHESSLIDIEKLKNFSHSTKATICNGCTNHCRLTINTFSDGNRYVSGNQCEKGAGRSTASAPLPNLYEFKRNYLTALQNKCENGTKKRTAPTPLSNRHEFEGNDLTAPQNKKINKATIGIPLALGMYELLPLWHGIFTDLGFDVVLSKMSTRSTYEKGQFTIPSDTACYPAKIMHGHIEELIEAKVDALFYPCLTYNIDEKCSDNHYNCPVVAYYSELLQGNADSLCDTVFLYPHLNVNSVQNLTNGLYTCLSQHFGGLKKSRVKRAVKHGMAEFERYRKEVKIQGQQALEYARKHNKRVMILAGRPYHIDSEICHGIDKLANSLGFVVVSEDSVYHLQEPKAVQVLNQWTYHSRLYRCAEYAASHPNTELVQLVSFGCGIDAITTDEVRSILENSGKYYTQLKIDEITNLGAIKIRLRSLLEALNERDKNG